MRFGLALLYASIALAQQPVPAGIWSLNLAKSHMKDGKPIPFNKSHTISMQPRESAVTWTEHRITSEGVMSANFANIPANGEDAAVTTFLDGKSAETVRASLRWEGRILVYTFKGPNFHGVRKMSLAPGGKTITANVEVNRFGTPAAWTEVWDRL